MRLVSEDGTFLVVTVIKPLCGSISKDLSRDIDVCVCVCKKEIVIPHVSVNK